MSHLPNVYKIQESHLIIPETSAGIERAFGTAMLILNDRQTYWYNVWANTCCKA